MGSTVGLGVGAKVGDAVLVGAEVVGLLVVGDELDGAFVGNEMVGGEVGGSGQTPHVTLQVETVKGSLQLSVPSIKATVHAGLSHVPGQS